MSANLPDDVLRDELAVSLARTIATANRHARELGVDAGQSLITITKTANGVGTVWRICYGPKNYIGRRGGDLIIDINQADGSIQNVLRGQ
jgi:hypothetical protein